MNLTQSLQGEYLQLWQSCTIRPKRLATVDALVDRLVADKRRYTAAGSPHGVPWHVVGLIHLLEASGNFSTHLHNGDPLTQRTVHVPAGRPPGGTPPFTWEESASDAVKLKLRGWTDWSIAGTLYQLERYNGFGYRSRGIHTPYLWSFSGHYSRGKYVRDGKYSPTAVSAQCGAAVLLRRLAERGIVAFSRRTLATTTDPPPARRGPALRYGPQKETAEGRRLQEFLNTFPGVALRVDGKLGERSSDAFKRATGHYLRGDPRAKKT